MAPPRRVIDEMGVPAEEEVPVEPVPDSTTQEDTAAAESEAITARLDRLEALLNRWIGLQSSPHPTEEVEEEGVRSFRTHYRAFTEVYSVLAAERTLAGAPRLQRPRNLAEVAILSLIQEYLEAQRVDLAMSLAGARIAIVRAADAIPESDAWDRVADAIEDMCAGREPLIAQVQRSAEHRGRRSAQAGPSIARRTIRPPRSPEKPPTGPNKQ